MLLFLASNICCVATYFSSRSLNGKTLDCFHLFNFHVPVRGFLWSEPLSHQWHMIDVFHINWESLCSTLLNKLEKCLLIAMHWCLYVSLLHPKVNGVLHLSFTLFFRVTDHIILFSPSTACLFLSGWALPSVIQLFVYASMFMYTWKRVHVGTHLYVCLCLCFMRGVMDMMMDFRKVNEL